MPFTRYAQRMLNPFRGIVNTVTYQSAEAVSVDGIHWDIYVRNEEILSDLESDCPIQTSEIRYGRWSKEHGLSRGTVHLSTDFNLMEAVGDKLYHYLSTTKLAPPFSLADNIELWLLDSQQQPLALLDSVVNEKDIDLRRPIDWRAGNACKQQFKSTAMQEIDTPHRSAGEYLTQYINSLTGEKPQAQWFQRHTDGSGCGVHDSLLTKTLQGRLLAADSFPMLLNLSADDHLHTQLLNDFLNWLSPWILLLTNLDKKTRQHFEQLTKHNASMVESQYKLYPEIIDQNAINAARVEAQLRKNIPEKKTKSDEIIPPYYIELNESAD